MSDFNGVTESKFLADQPQAASAPHPVSAGGPPKGSPKPAPMSLNGWIGSLMNELDDQDLPRA